MRLLLVYCCCLLISSNPVSGSSRTRYEEDAGIKLAPIPATNTTTTQPIALSYALPRSLTSKHIRDIAIVAGFVVVAITLAAIVACVKCVMALTKNRISDQRLHFESRANREQITNRELRPWVSQAVFSGGQGEAIDFEGLDVDSHHSRVSSVTNMENV